MEIHSSYASMGRRPFFRQSAVTENSDVADGPVGPNQNAKTVPSIQSGFPKLKPIHEHSKEVSHRNLPNFIAAQENSSQNNSPQGKNGSRSQDENVAKTIQLFAKYVYSARLSAYDRLLFRQRNSKTIRYHQTTLASAEEIPGKIQEAEKPSRRRDISDGLPASSEVLVGCKQEKLMLAHHIDYSDVFPRELDISHQQPPSGYCGGVESHLQESKSGSEQSADEGFQNGDPGRYRSSVSLSSEVRESPTLLSGRDVPKIEVNGEEKKFISEEGRQKGERFRQSKKSSGYGTGGSDDIFEGEYFSSVFGSSETSVDKDDRQKKALEDDHQILKSCFPSNEDAPRCEPNAEGLAKQPKASQLGKGERQGEWRETNLPGHFCCEKRIAIPSHIKDVVISNTANPELMMYFEEIVNANLNMPFPKFDLSKLERSSLEDDFTGLILTEVETDNKFLEYLARSMAPLSSQSWALEDSISSEEHLHLQLSAESVPSLYRSASRSKEPLDSGIRGLSSLPVDDVDGNMDPPGYATTSAEARPVPSQQLNDVASANHLAGPRIIGHSSPITPARAKSASDVSPEESSSSVAESGIRQLNGYSTARNRSRSQPTANGIYTVEGATGFSDRGAGSKSRGPTLREWETSPDAPVGNGFAGPCRRRQSNGYTRSQVVRGSEPYTCIMAPTGQVLGYGCTCPSYKYKDQSPPQPCHLMLERSVFCMKRLSHSNCSDSCLKGKKQILLLKEHFLKDKIRDKGDIMRCLWDHSKQCREMQCIVPFCDVYRRQHLSFEEQFAQMCRGALNRELQMELVHALHTQVRSQHFLQLSPSSLISHESWTTARVQEGQFLGDFGDFNILRARVVFRDNAPLNVVIKKAVCHPDSKTVFFRINVKSSQYIVQSLWCSDLHQENYLLVCSVHYPAADMNSLHTVMMYRDLTFDLCLQLLQQVLRAALYLHSIEIVYLNWKCSTVLWDGRTDGVNIKLCNFSRAVQVKQGSLVRCPASIVDTYDPCFVAPEVFCGEPLSYNSDVWGIGCLLHEMLYKKPPYSDHCHQSPAHIREMVRANQLEAHFPTNHARVLPILCACWERSAPDRCTAEKLLELVTEDLLLLPKMADQAER